MTVAFASPSAGYALPSALLVVAASFDASWGIVNEFPHWPSVLAVVAAAGPGLLGASRSRSRKTPP